MKILFLAPQPFFQERGTPIAVRLALEVLAKRGGDIIDLLVYHEGTDIEIPRVAVHRIPALPFLHGIRPSISIKKLLCDFIFFFSALRLILKNRHAQYTLIHAVEESVFMAFIFKLFFKIPYIYDMDSSLSMQITEKWCVLKPIEPALAIFERIAIRNSRAVVPVCDALAALADHHGAPDMEILRDISLLHSSAQDGHSNLREELNLTANNEIVMYIGNLEAYQGIDLLLESFAVSSPQHQSAHLIIIGGTDAHIQHYKSRAQALGIDSHTHLIGPRPVSHLRHYLTQADILTSPRTKGENTPMKIYSYLHSAVPILATNLSTNTQVLTDSIARLANPTPSDFGAALLELLENPTKRKAIGTAAFSLAEERYTFPVFERSLNTLYDRLRVA